MTNHDSNQNDPTPRNSNNRNSKKGLSAGFAAGLLGGAAAGLIVGVPGMSSAASDATFAAPAAIVQQVDDAPTDDAPVDEPVDGERQQRGERLREGLQPLVDDGTIDGTQADAVTDHLVENLGERGDRGDRHGRRGPGKFAGSEVVTELLGLDADALRTELQAGSTLADIAVEQGVSVDALVDAIVAEMQERADAAVESGRINADEAAEKLADAEARVTARVNGERPDADVTTDGN